MAARKSVSAHLWDAANLLAEPSPKMRGMCISICKVSCQIEERPASGTMACVAPTKFLDSFEPPENKIRRRSGYWMPLTEENKNVRLTMLLLAAEVARRAKL